MCMLSCASIIIVRTEVTKRATALILVLLQQQKYLLGQCPDILAMLRSVGLRMHLQALKDQLARKSWFI